MSSSSSFAGRSETCSVSDSFQLSSFELLLTSASSHQDRLLLRDDVQAGTTAFEYLRHSRQDVDGTDDKEEWRSLTVRTGRHHCSFFG